MPDRRFAAAMLLVTVQAVTAQQFLAQSLAIRISTPNNVALPMSGAWSYGAAGDFDGDGTTDLSIVCSNTCRTLRRTTAGWQSIGNPHATLSQRPIAYDFDNDRDNDILLAPAYLGPTRACRLRRTDFFGVVTDVTPPMLNNLPVAAAAIGDIDGDSRADVLCSTVAGGSVPGLLLITNASSPAFRVATLPAGLPGGLWPVFFDIDGDGDDDILASNATAGWLLLRNDAGVMVDASATLAALPRGHVHLLTGDLDADGRVDCAAVRNTGEVDVLWGAPGGAVLGSNLASLPTTRALLSGDFDGDGDLDLLAERSLDMAVLWNQGNRSFAVEANPNTADATPTVCDFDGDGGADVLFATAGRRDELRCLFRGRVEDAAFQRGLTLPLSNSGLTAAVDLDRDGRVDLATAATGSVLAQMAMGGGIYRQTRSPAPGLTATPSQYGSGDLDGDGDNDLVLLTPAQLYLLAYAGNGTFQPLLNRASSGSGLDTLRVEDIDGDGDLDILQADSRGVVLTRNLGSSQFSASVSILPVAGAAHCFEVLDVDNDGDLDIVADVIAPSLVTHTIATNDGTGTFTIQPHSYVNLGIAPTLIRRADLDGNGTQDLVVIDGSLRLYRGDGTGVFVDRTPYDVPTGQLITSNVVIADFDGDDDPDILCAHSNGVLLLLNDGTGHFSDHSSLAAGAPLPVSALRAFDCDGDGDIDVLCRAGVQELLSINLVRHLRLPVAPSVGGLATIDIMTRHPGPGGGLAAILFATAPAAVPIHLPGILGALDLDPASLDVLGLVQTSAIGLANAFVSVPSSPQLFGTTLCLQAGLLFPSTPGSLTNAIVETILR